ncbi:MAG: 6-phosphogluconate dehydrogenase [Bacteroidetes bacterium]|nr:MAG: 6-phosphogluconate dehydrogenase [Bacteroidota bacterium]
MALNIGFIGLGNLGSPIAQNLLTSGHTLHIYNRTPLKAVPLAAKGAVVSESIGALAKNSQVVFSIVSDDAALKSICEGDQGLIKNLAPGSIHVSMSTILPGTAKELAEKHEANEQHYLSAPVFGRPEAALAKKLNFVVSGNEKVKEQIKPLFEDAGSIGVWDFGEDPTTANTVKLCGNFLIASAIEAIGESISLASRSGVDAKKMWDMFLKTILSAPIYQSYSNIILQQKFEPASFTARLGVKDLNLVLAQATAADVPMPLAALVKKNMQQLVADGKGETDWSAVATVSSN